MAFVVLKGRQPRRQRQAEGEAACWCRARSWRSCLRSPSAPQVWVQGAWWVVAKRGGGCVAQSVLRFTVPQLQLPSVGVYGTRHPTPKPAKRCRSSRVLTALITSREVLRPTQDRATHTAPTWHLTFRLPMPAANTKQFFFLFHGWTDSSRLDPADSLPFFHGLYILVKCLK